MIPRFTKLTGGFGGGFGHGAAAGSGRATVGKLPIGALMGIVGALPVVGLIAFRLVLPAHGPSQAMAFMPSVPFMTQTVEPRPEPVPADPALVRAIAELAEKPFGASPVRAAAIPVILGNTQGSERPATAAQELLPSDVTVTSIMMGKDGPVAIIRGKRRVVGQPVAQDWTVADIDPKGGTVTVRHTRGEIKVLNIRRMVEKPDF